MPKRRNPFVRKPKYGQAGGRERLRGIRSDMWYHRLALHKDTWNGMLSKGECGWRDMALEQGKKATYEKETHCMINEMQNLVRNSWAYVYTRAEKDLVLFLIVLYRLDLWLEYCRFF